MNPGSGDYPPLRLPAGRLFGERARRLRQLAQGHGLGDFLAFTAQLAEAQQTLFYTYPDIPLPDLAFLQRCQEHGMAPLAPAGWTLGTAWRQALTRLVAQIRQAPTVPAATQAALTRLAGASSEDWIEAQARLILDDDLTGLDLATAPFIGAALQVHWTRLAAHLQPERVAPPADKALCPVCGSPPVAGVIRAGLEDAGLRYLHCALCNCQWHRVRAECSQCGNDRDLGYYHLEGRQDDPVSAEACPSCQGYLKICRLEKDHLADPLADDLASLSLDLLMGEEGFARAGVNYLLWQGADPAQGGQD